MAGHPASPPAGTEPAGVTFPHGLFLFTTTGCVPGSSLTMTITYPALLVPNSRYWKYGPRPGPIAAGWYVVPASIVSDTATFSITDGGVGDDDLAADGTIVDQGGPGFGPPVPIPALSPWMLTLLSLMLIGVAMLQLRGGAGTAP